MPAFEQPASDEEASDPDDSIQEDVQCLLPSDEGHFCTDVPALALLFIGLCCMGYVHAYSHQHGNVQRLLRGFDYSHRICGVDLPDAWYLYWCRDTQGRLELNYPICVPFCPQNASSRVECPDPSYNVTTFVPTYATVKLGPVCLPPDRAESKALLHKVIGTWKIGLFVEAYTTIKGSWPLLVEGGFIGICVAYAYLRILQSYARLLWRGTMLVLMLGPLVLGARYVSIGVSGSIERGMSSGDSEVDSWIGLALLGFSFSMTIVYCCFRGVKTAVSCTEAASELFSAEMSILLAPFLSFLSKAALLFYMVNHLLLLLSCVEFTDYDPFGVRRSVRISWQEVLLVAAHFFWVFWLIELSDAISEYAIGWTAQKWYFNPPPRGHKPGDSKLAAPSGGLIRGYLNAFRYHPGSIALGSLMIMLIRPTRIVMGVVMRVVQAYSHCCGAWAVQAEALLAEHYRMYIRCWEKCAYTDIAISSRSLRGAARHATEVVCNEVPAITTLRGAQLIFSFSGIGLVCMVPVYVLEWQCHLAKELHWPETYNPARPRWILLVLGFIGMSIGFSFMLVFDTVVGAVLYCFALDQQHHSQLQRAAKAERRDVRATHWLWGAEGGAGGHHAPEEHLECAPAKLRDLIKSQDNVYH